MWVSSCADRGRPGSADPGLDRGHEAALALVAAHPHGRRGRVERLLDVDGCTPLMAEQGQPGVRQGEARVDGGRMLQGDLGSGLHPQQRFQRGAVGDRGLRRGAHRQAVAVARPAHGLGLGELADDGRARDRAPARGSPGSRSTRRAGRGAAHRAPTARPGPSRRRADQPAGRVGVQSEPQLPGPDPLGGQQVEQQGAVPAPRLVARPGAVDHGDGVDLPQPSASWTRSRSGVSARRRRSGRRAP